MKIPCSSYVIFIRNSVERNLPIECAMFCVIFRELFLLVTYVDFMLIRSACIPAVDLSKISKNDEDRPLESLLEVSIIYD